jgi:hypothetical protein
VYADEELKDLKGKESDVYVKKVDMCKLDWGMRIAAVRCLYDINNLTILSIKIKTIQGKH